MENVDRRRFLRLSAAAAGSAALTLGAASPAHAREPTTEHPTNGERMALLMDNSLCINCQACRLACQNENNLPASRKYIRFDYVERGEFPNVESLVNRHSCQHCNEAPCVDICPVDALRKGELGFTHTDFDTCIGCGACLTVCPFEVPIIAEEPETGARKMYKCNACEHLINEGYPPACTTTCITGAVSYGPWDEMVRKAEDRAAAIRARFPEATVYGKAQQNGLGFLIVLRTPAEDYPHLV